MRVERGGGAVRAGRRVRAAVPAVRAAVVRGHGAAPAALRAAPAAPPHAHAARHPARAPRVRYPALNTQPYKSIKCLNHLRTIKPQLSF